MSIHPRRHLISTLCALLAPGLAGASAQVPTPGERGPQIQAAAQAIGQAVREVQRLPGAFPAVSAVVVHGEETPLLLARGELHAGHARTADANSRFYIASQTKSFVGLLAVELDAQGVLPLSTTLAEVWPGLRLPSPAEPADISLADLLAH